MLPSKSVQKRLAQQVAVRGVPEIVHLPACAFIGEKAKHVKRNGYRHLLYGLGLLAVLDVGLDESRSSHKSDTRGLRRGKNYSGFFPLSTSLCDPMTAASQADAVRSGAERTQGSRHAQWRVFRYGRIDVFTETNRWRGQIQQSRKRRGATPAIMRLAAHPHCCHAMFGRRHRDHFSNADVVRSRHRALHAAAAGNRVSASGTTPIDCKKNFLRHANRRARQHDLRKTAQLFLLGTCRVALVGACESARCRIEAHVRGEHRARDFRFRIRHARGHLQRRWRTATGIRVKFDTAATSARAVTHRPPQAGWRAGANARFSGLRSRSIPRKRPGRAGRRALRPGCSA